MTPADRDALCNRGMDDIFDPALRASIVDLIEDQRALSGCQGAKVLDCLGRVFDSVRHGATASSFTTHEAKTCMQPKECTEVQ